MQDETRASENLISGIFGVINVNCVTDVGKLCYETKILHDILILIPFDIILSANQ